jgi:hypothetical protein
MGHRQGGPTGVHRGAAHDVTVTHIRRTGWRRPMLLDLIGFVVVVLVIIGVAVGAESGRH